ncbi:MAG TPA: ThuA domain-containing protein [Spirochaetia bacterium]|nr:ThuA domain-containing protein [Spirochaetia bacterium]
MKQAKTRLLLLATGETRYHDHRAIGLFLKTLLRDAGFSVTLVENVSALAAENLCRCDAVVTYTVNAAAPETSVRKLCEAIAGITLNDRGRPAGFIGIHGATTSFQNSNDYKEMIGATFITHPEWGPEYRFSVRDPAHPVTKGVVDFILQDELYLFETHAAFHTLVSCHYEGSERPVVWCKPYGRGRICYIALGHGVTQLQHAAVGRLILNGIRWATTDNGGYNGGGVLQ